MSPIGQFNLAAAGTLGFGLVLTLLPETTQPLWNLLLFGQLATPAWLGPQALAYVVFLYGVLGAVLVGWAAALLWLGMGPLRRGEAWAWRAAAISVLAWFVLDVAVSLRLGYWPNALLNLGFFASFAWPLWRLRRVTVG